MHTIIISMLNFFLKIPHLLIPINTYFDLIHQTLMLLFITNAMRRYCFLQPYPVLQSTPLATSTSTKGEGNLIIDSRPRHLRTKIHGSVALRKPCRKLISTTTTTCSSCSEHDTNLSNESNLESSIIRSKQHKHTTLIASAYENESRRDILKRLVSFLYIVCSTLLHQSDRYTAAIAAPAVKQVQAETETETSLPVSDLDPSGTDEPTITDRIYIDISITPTPSLKNKPALNMKEERIVLGLYGDLLPKVVDNFKRLCTANTYDNTYIYRIVPGLTIQMGDTLNNKGKTGRSSFESEESFIPDSFRVQHTIPGIVSMVRRRDGSVDSRFFITTRQGDSMYLDGKYAAFGRVVEGMNVLSDIERAGGEGYIKRPVQILRCGVLSP